VPAAIRAGERANAELFFRCERAIAEDWQVFVHGDADGATHRLHADHYPALATDACRPGDIVRDRFVLDVPRDDDASARTLWFGFYDGRRRLAVRGAPDADDARVRGPTVTIVR
jgi:hypothetical protein